MFSTKLTAFHADGNNEVAGKFVEIGLDLKASKYRFFGTAIHQQHEKTTEKFKTNLSLCKSVPSAVQSTGIGKKRRKAKITEICYFAIKNGFKQW